MTSNMEMRRHRDDRLNEELWAGRLPVGLEVFVMPKPGFNKKYAVFSTRYGSIDRGFRLPTGEWVSVADGTAHFLEHKLFEEETGNVFDRFAAQGASANAYTSYTMTSYLFSCSDNFEENLDTLLDFVQEPYFTAANVEKEQGIIEQEIRMYQDQAPYRAMRNLLRALYHHHPVRIDILGSVESIRQIDPESLYRCHEAFYHPSNMALFVVGDLDPGDVMARVEADVSARGYNPRPPVVRELPDEPADVVERRVVDRLNVSRPRYLLGFKGRAEGLDGPGQLERQIALDLVTAAVFGRSSALYERLYEEGLIDDGFGARTVVGDGFVYTVVGGETRDPDRLHEAVCAEVERVRRTGLSPEDIRRLQKRDVGDFLRLFNSLEFIANGFLHYHFMGSSLLDYVKILERLDVDTVERRMRDDLDLARSAVSIILPSRRAPAA